MLRDYKIGIILESPTHGTHLAVLDAKNYRLVQAMRWYCHKSRERLYAETTLTMPDRKQEVLKMHHLILDIRAGEVVNHRDSNSLNNSEDNLRRANHGESMRSRGLAKHSTTGYKGVCHYASKGYVARITVGGRRICLGTYQSAERAARAYDAGAIRYHGQFAKVNFPAEAA